MKFAVSKYQVPPNLCLFDANSKDDRKKFNDVIGIYAIVYKNQIIYVCRSRQIGKRIAAHMSQTALERILKRKEKYDNTKGDKYPQCFGFQIEFYKFIQTHRNNIKFCILKECAIEQLNHKEELFINKYHPKFNYAGNVSHFVPIKH